MNTISVIVDAMERQGEDNLSVRLVAPDNRLLPAFEAGAHIDLHLPNGLIRPYSLASAPTERSFYLLCIKHSESSRGGSRYVHQQLRVGQQLEISPPRNLFPLISAPSYLLIAGGIGITPIRAMAETLSFEQQTFELYYYTKSLNQLVFKDQWQNTSFADKTQICLSSEGKSPRQWQPESLKHWDGKTHLFLCGPIGMMDFFTALATDAGWPESHIHREAFSVIQPTKVDDDSFTVEIASSGKTYAIPSDKSIASVLLAAGEPISLSCEMGMCGACLTRVLSGTPDHRDSVQSEADKNSAEPLIALCCSRSKSAHLHLDL